MMDILIPAKKMSMVKKFLNRKDDAPG